MSNSKLTKKKGIAPLVKLPRIDSENNPKNALESREVNPEFTEEFLEEIFATKSSENSKMTTTTKSDYVDLDDWDFSVKSVPSPAPSNSNRPNLITKQEFQTDKEKKIPGLVCNSLITDSSMSIAQRKQMFFSSSEFEEDSTLKLRFLKRNVPATRLKDLKNNREHIKLSDVSKWPQSKNWFVHGVVTESGQLKSSAGSRIDITNLAAEPYSVRVLLFGSAYQKNLSNIPAGTIVCLLNPTKGKPFNGNFTLVINNESQIIVAGTSRDYGLCGATKKGGGHCRNVVNMHICRYCRFHAVQEYKKQRMSKDICAAAKGVGLGGKKADPALWNAPADRAKFLTPGKQNLCIARKDNDILARLDSPRAKTLSEDKKSFKPLVETNVLALKRKRSEVEVQGKKKLNATSNDQAKVEKCYQKPIAVSRTPRLSAAKQRALEFARSNNGIETPKPKPKIEEVKPGETKNNANLITEEFLALMAAGSSNPKLAAEAEAEEQNKKFDRLQVIEEVSEKLVATHEVPTRAIRCIDCSKTFHQLPLQCVMNQHKSRIVMGTKRFFQCAGCKGRTTTLERFPSSECSTCRTWSWKRAGMTAEKICTVSAPLSVRGLEETFLGSAVSDANMSMLVPDDKIN